ncbi:tetraspanin pls1 family [Moniliophthora roreri MCA 2997]|uniref:Tetraspanin pls1 family n=2 Tax=Moniliophthora roreri TaxID=221103 RepID=V2X132_MONRO|nr:tetraspanin pls1 family [Moniliophthora roreri MCA 2997]KAI3610741.1 tetraspanin pls1 family [Moniliophthora roreri]
MVSRALMGVWAFLDFCLLGSGIIAVAFSVLWRKPDTLMNMVLSNGNLTSGMALGIALLITFLFSVGAIVQRNHVTIGLVILNYLLILDGLAIIIIGTFVWVATLRERDDFHIVYSRVPTSARVFIQEKFSCCGYFNGSDLNEPSTFCNPTQTSFINALDPNDVNNSKFFCVTPVTNFADVTLNNIFTTIYGFMAVVLCLLLATLCVINMRKEEERFKRIDAKRGGKGFV